LIVPEISSQSTHIRFDENTLFMKKKNNIWFVRKYSLY